ncbi:MAG: hypothetical protein HND47_16450 [Chloroflexi bacterium]|nr:hypothetical protein [Chloroflexota bacterium]
MAPSAMNAPARMASANILNEFNWALFTPTFSALPAISGGMRASKEKLVCSGMGSLLGLNGNWTKEDSPTQYAGRRTATSTHRLKTVPSATYPRKK